jgi:N-acetyl-gamma-glutamyl-phosphate reductase
MIGAMINVGIFGATGYTGLEVVRTIARHPGARVVFATSENNAGQRLSDALACPFDIPLIKADDATISDADIVFSCLHVGDSAKLCKRVIDAGKRALDFSADYRLRDLNVYKQFYKLDHPHPELLNQAVYGLPEIYRADLTDASLVANPGCYPTSMILASLPLLELDALADKTIIADSKSGVSGAGRKPSQTTHFVEVSENLTPYNIGRVHRHVPETEQELNALYRGEGDVTLIFSPHLLPISRGMLSTMYFRLTPQTAQQDWHQIFTRRYEGEPFIRVLPKGQTASIAHVQRLNYCALSVHPIAPDRLIVVSAIDNLVKGASGQAIQSMNVMFGLDERTGLL